MAQRIGTFCDAHGISESALIYAASALTMHYFRQTDRFSIGIPVLGRTTQAEMRTMGLYMHIVPLIVEVGDADLLTFLHGVEERVFDLFRHQKFTVYDIRNEIKNLPVYGTLYDVIVDYTIYEAPPEYESHVLYNDYIEGAMELHFLKENGALKYTLRCRNAIARDSVAARFHALFTAVLSTVLRSPETKIRETANLLANAEKPLLHRLNDTVSAFDPAQSVYDLFLRQAQSAPDRPAVKAADRFLSYGELHRESAEIAAALQNAGMGPGDIVAVCLPRDSRFVCAVLGVVKAGAAYLPLDPQQPEERRRFCIKDSGAKLCVTEQNYAALLKEPPSAERPPADGNALCYCIYTSGSTGKPKGVLIRRRNLTAYLHALNMIYGPGKANMPLFTSVGVDLTVTSLFLPLVTGGCVYAYTGDLAESLPQIIGNRELNILKLTPTHMRILCALVPQTELRNLKHVIAGGEALTRRDAEAFLRHFGAHLKIHNEYGPTETTVGCMDYVFDPKDAADVPPIGRPMANMRVYVVNPSMQSLPIGVTGELCVAGASVGAGYMNRPELTEEKFVPDPFGEGRMYKTGDLAYVREDGLVVFAGRNDLQIKLNGHRVEPGEIEAALCSVDGVENAAAVVRNQAGRQILCAFYTGREIPARDLREILGRTLPQYMIPQVFARLAAMPLTASGKTDRAALSEVECPVALAPEAVAPPSTPEQRALAEAIAAALGLESVSMTDNYYALGGDSIRAIHIAAALAAKGYSLDVSEIMRRAVLGDIAEKMIPLPMKKAVPSAPAAGPFPLTPAQEGIWLHAMRSPESAAYRLLFLLEVTRPISAQVLREAFLLLSLRHPALCCSFPSENAAGALFQTEQPGRTFPLRETVYPFVKDEAFLESRLAEAAALPLSLSDDVLLRAESIVFKDARYLLITAHHIILDGWSMPVLARDLFGFTERLSAGEPFSKLREAATDTPVRTVFRRYASALADMDKTQAQNHWDRLLDGCRPRRLFAGVASGEEIDDLREVLEADVPSDALTGAGRLCQTLAISENTLLEGAFALALRRVFDGEDVLFCKAISGRSLPVDGIEQGVGPFLNTTPARYVLRCPGQTIRNFLRETHEQSILANRFGVLRLGEVLRRAGITPEDAEVLFAFENYYFDNNSAPSLSSLPFRLAEVKEQTEFPLAVTLRQTDGGLKCRIVYAPRKCTRAQTVRLADEYVYMLRRLTANGGESLTVSDLFASGEARIPALPTEVPRAEPASFLPPAAPAEKTLAEAVKNVLSVPAAGMNDNFFTLGGDSIRAIYLASELRSAGWLLRITEILRAGSLRELAKKMTPFSPADDAPAGDMENRIPLPPVAKAYLKACPAAPERFWQSCIVHTDYTAKEMQAALKALTRRHPILRSVLRNGELQILPDEASSPRFHAETVSFEEGGIAEARRRLYALDVSFNLSEGPLADAAFVTAPEGSLLRLSIHHLVVDLFSWEILLGDLRGILLRNADPAAPALPGSTAGFSRWIAALNQYKTDMPPADAAFWGQRRTEAGRAVPLFSASDPLLPGESAELSVDASLTSALLRMETSEGVRMDALLLAALGRAAARIAGGDVCVCVESLGRPQLNDAVRIDRTVGWFTAVWPVVIGEQGDMAQLLFSVRRELRRVPQSGVGWLLLNETLPEKAGLMFNFYRSGGEVLGAQPVFPSEDRLYGILFPAVISVDCVLSSGALNVRFCSPALRRRPELLRELTEGFLHTLNEIAAYTGFSGRMADAADTYSDDALTLGELSALNAIFNGVDEDEQN